MEKTGGKSVGSGSGAQVARGCEIMHADNHLLYAFL